MSCTFTNDNNVTINLINSHISNTFKGRYNHEVIFRKINTYLINNKIIQNNIIDLGAWIGDNSIPWGKNIEGIVYAIDPSPDNISFITETCKLNNINNVKYIEKAISDKPGRLSTHESINHCSFVYNKKPEAECKHIVDSTSLDYLYEAKEIDNIGYIHLDVEGMEHNVLCGSKNIIETFHPVISFEQHLEIDDYDIILKLLNDNDYHVFLVDEILPGCRLDCRNSFAFHNNIYNPRLIDDINSYLGRNIMIPK